MLTYISLLSKWAVPTVVIFVPLYAFIKGIKVYEIFVEGAKEGLTTAIRILPNLLAMLVVIGICREAGVFDTFSLALAPLLKNAGIPPEVLPLAVIRPFTGSGALGMTAELISFHGAESFVGRLASTMQGSTDTTFYVLTVYFSSVGIYKTRHAIVAGLAGDIAGFTAAVIVCGLYFL